MFKRFIYSEETELVNFRVPKSEKPQFVKDVRDLLWKYDVRNLSNNVSDASAASFNDDGSIKTLISHTPKPVRNFHGGLRVDKRKTECYLVDKFKNLYGDRDFPDDLYVDCPEYGMIHYTNSDNAQKYMTENGIK